MHPKTLARTGLLWLAGIALAACAAPAGQPDAATGTLSGSVTYRERIALDPGAVIEVQLVDVSQAGAPAGVIATQTIQSEGQQVPISFTLTYDPAQIDEQLRYNVSARILVNGQPTWSSQQPYPVLTQGAPTENVEIVVSPATTDSTGLLNKVWTLQTMVLEGTDFALADGVTTTVRFADNGTYSGNGGCNGYSGIYTHEGNTLALEMAMATLMACPTGMEQEGAFFAALPRLTTFEATAEGLRLASADGQTELNFTGG